MGSQDAHRGAQNTVYISRAYEENLLRTRMLRLDKETVSMSEDIKGYQNVNRGQHQNS
jgi:hypothetical protein